MIDNNVVARRQAPVLHAATVQRLTGTRAEVTAALRQYRAAGQLSDVGQPRAVPGHPGLIWVDARLVALPAAPPAPARRPRWPYVVAAVVAVLAALGWAVYAVASTVVAAPGGILAALVIGALVVLGLRASRRRGCTTTVTVTHHH